MLPCMLVVGTFDESLKIGVLQALQSKHFNIVSITTMHGDHFKGGGLIENVMRERGDGGILIILVNTRKFSLLFKRRKIQRQFNEPIFSIWYPVSGIYLTTSRS